MLLVVDANIALSSLISGGLADLILSPKLEPVAPERMFMEIRGHRAEALLKSKLSEIDFEVLLALIFENIKIIPFLDYTGFVGICKGKISDPDDIPVLATALATRAQGIWAHDPHFLEQKKIKIFTNKDMLELIERGI